MENDLKCKMRGEEIKEQTAEEKEEEVKKRADRSAELEFQLRAKLADGLNQGSSSSSSSDDEASKKEEEKKAAEEAQKESRRRLDDYDYSSGVESDNDVDLLVEQEVLHSIKLKREQAKREEDELRAKGELPSVDEQITVSKEEA